MFLFWAELWPKTLFLAVFLKFSFFYHISAKQQKFKNPSDDPKSIPLIHILAKYGASTMFDLGCREVVVAAPSTEPPEIE